jgi:hypothetical protein
VLLGLAILAGTGAPAVGSEPFEICESQTYALCASASCFVFNQVAYCKCDIEFGDSITATDAFDGGDACSVNEQGPDNGYLVSTYSLPESVLEGGSSALYTCRGSSANGAYAQCDGGICFASTSGQSFPGLGTISEDEIVCSCPITVANPKRQHFGYQFVGPYPCQEEILDSCRRESTNKSNGSTIPVGAPTGTPRVLTRMLDGSVPKLNHCR